VNAGSSFIIFAALNIAMVWIGADAVDECPVQKMVPNYLIGNSLIWWPMLYDHYLGRL
jgi:hypothetical protein